MAKVQRAKHADEQYNDDRVHHIDGVRNHTEEVQSLSTLVGAMYRAGSVAASTTNGKRNTSACGLISQYLSKTAQTTPDQISVENLVQNA